MSEASVDIIVPRETVNDDTVKVIRWLVADGDAVRAGTSVVELETSKSVIDVEAPADGVVVINSAAGASVAVGGVLGAVSARAAAAKPANRPTPQAAPAAIASAGSGATISARARELMQVHGLDESAFSHLGLVREADVAAFLAERDGLGAPATSGAAPASVATPVKPAEKWAPKGLFGDAARASQERRRSLPWLAINYLWRNWLLGNLVRIAPRGVINVLHRLRGVTMGRDCYIDPAAIIETAYPENVTLGDDVRVTAGAIIMTHIKGPHYLRDRGFVPVVLQPVVLHDHCFIGVNAVILPGVTVGRASVVASGAVVTADVPPLTMVAGNPAKVVKRFSDTATS
jgi:acetyltransferase-like isoleucine patch superfamily enzyme